ncbi:MAG: hypothetical protein PSV13_04355 [Lacunisphaera sp.]|nr:hypothetical protein [Lacunisphaera sp.]
MSSPAPGNENKIPWACPGDFDRDRSKSNLIHLPVYYIVEKLIPEAPLLVRLSVKVPVSIALAAASFYLVERRCLHLKDRFESPVPRGTETRGVTGRRRPSRRRGEVTAAPVFSGQPGNYWRRADPGACGQARSQPNLARRPATSAAKRWISAWV